MKTKKTGKAKKRNLSFQKGYEHSFIPKNYIDHKFRDYRLIRTTPGKASDGSPFDAYVRNRFKQGKLRLECIRADVLGLERPIEVYRQQRTANLIKPWDAPGGDESYCPAHWADLAIGCGACGFRCRACFLMLTHRVKADPSRHILYDNVDDYETAVRKWLKRPNRRNLGLGIDCSDSLLYEGVTGHARRLIPMFNNPKVNPHSCSLIVLTKSVNVRYLEGLPTKNVLITHSLNPESIADIWEGRWPDGKRITPPMEKRLADSMLAARWGFAVRWRIDPILPVDGWEELYGKFFCKAASKGHKPARITLGTYREAQKSLATFSAKWGLPPMEWTPTGLEKDGMHRHLPAPDRQNIYSTMKRLIDKAWKGSGHIPLVGICKESKKIHKAVGSKPGQCNCET